MAKKTERSDGSRSSRELTPETPKKPRVIGTDHALTLSTAQGTSLDLSYWDLWFSIVAVLTHDGHLDRLSNQIKKDKALFYDNHTMERKLSHICDLSRRLAEASVIPADVVQAVPDLAKIEKQRAIYRMSMPLRTEREWSAPMQNTPRQQRFPHALRGHWDKFPVSPESYAKTFGARFRKRVYVSKDASFRISEALDEYVEEAKTLVGAGSAAQALALLRGWMTVVVELMPKVNDSFGRVGMSFEDGFTAYLKIPLDQTGIDDRVFFSDLLDFLIWEDYGLTNDGIEGYFRGLDHRQADLCVEHLRREVAALRDDDLEYESEEALTLLGQVIAEQERFDEFEDLAQQMGSRAWKRIVRLADIAMQRKKKPLALKVFEAAMTPGNHLDFLTKKYEKLKKGHWSPDPKK
jgi:hypothetical protein